MHFYSADDWKTFHENDTKTFYLNENMYTFLVLIYLLMNIRVYTNLLELNNAEYSSTFYLYDNMIQT